MNTATRLVVDASIGDARWSQVWDSPDPLTIGHAMKCRLERTREGVRIRFRDPREGVNAPVRTRDIAMAGQESAELEVQQGFRIRLRSLRAVTPACIDTSAGNEASRKAALPPSSVTHGELRFFSQLGDWILDSAAFTDEVKGRVGDREVFTLKKEGASYRLTALAPDLQIALEGKHAEAIAQSETVAIDSEALVSATLQCGTVKWTFTPSYQPALPIARHQVTQDDLDAAWFKLCLRYCGIGFGLFCLLSLVWPKPDPQKEELVPPQFAKLVLQKSPAGHAGIDAAAGGGAHSTAQKKVEKTAMVQAFRAKALRNAVSGLLKGGMTTLLAQSEFVTGSEASASARRILDARSDSLAPTAPVTGVLNGRSVAVASLGGEAGNGRGGKGVGYGKGTHAGVQGQGKSFVAMDTAGSSVDEGLTKDEVGEVIHRHLSEVRYCYESAMIRTPDLEGKLVVNFTIGGNGVVKSTEVKESNLPDPRLDDCILRRLATWKFPLPRGGVDVAVSYPFLFKTLGR